MALRPQNYPESQTLTALGVARFIDTSNVVIAAPDGTAFMPAGPLQSVTPVTGDTVATPDTAANGTLYLTPAGTLATLTVNLPSDANSVLNEHRKIFSTQVVTALTVAQAGGGGVFITPVTALAANTPVTLVKVAANTWAKM